MQATLDAAFGKEHQGTVFFDNQNQQQVILMDDLTLKAQTAQRPGTAARPRALDLCTRLAGVLCQQVLGWGFCVMCALQLDSNEAIWCVYFGSSVTA